MKQFSRAEGRVQIRLPDSAGDVEDTAATPPRRSRAQTGAQSSGLEPELQIILDSLSESLTSVDKPLHLVDRFVVDAGSGTAGTRGSASGERQAMDIELNLDAGESAVVLTEQDGSYEWHFPARRSTTEGLQRRAPGRAPRSGPASRIAFRIPIGDSGRLPRGTRSGPMQRGPITGFIKGRVQAFVLRFIARKSIGALTRRLERGVEEGPVIINSAEDALLWKTVPGLTADSLPTPRARRILLLVHGTFSSTIGSFGALCAHEQGQALLQQAIAHYDMVIGHDHYTLSETPEQNAEALLRDLLPLLADGQALEIDAIAYSRGGLVLRYLSEMLTADAGVAITFRKAIFVGCTNGGTELANDENWKHLVDIYTNMSAGATRLLALAPGAALPARILRQSIRIIGSLVTYIAQDSIANHAVPGVASMEPDGDFVQALNRLPQARQLPAIRENYAIASNFEPSLHNDAFGIGKTLALKVADGFVDRLMGKDNDLVVNNDSMFVLDPLPSARLRGSRRFEANGSIYHTLYFHQPQIVTTCGEWLGLLQAAIAPGSASRQATASPSSDISAATPPRPWWPDVVADDWLMLAFTSACKDALRDLKRSQARHAIVQRLHKGDRLYYGFTRANLIEQLKDSSDPHAAIGDLLGLQERQSRMMSEEDALRSGSGSALRQAARELLSHRGAAASVLAVIVDRDEPVGLVMPEVEAVESPFDIEPPRMLPTPQPTPAAEDSILPENSRRAPTRHPASARSAPVAETASASEAPQTVWCHMHAAMDEELPVQSIATLEVTLSRDLIARESGISGSGQVRTDKKLIIQALARKHCDLEGSDRCEIDVPAEGDEASVFFEIKALHEGIGEVDIFARQGNQPIIRLKLRPRFIARGARPTEGSTLASAVLEPISPRRQLADVLYIYDVQIGQERILEFNIQSPQVRLQGRYRSKPFKTEDARQQYISKLYREIEQFRANNQDDYDSFMEELMAHGAGLFEELVPAEIQERLWKARKTLKGIQVISDEPFIPWELLYIKQPGKPIRGDSSFLAELGMLRWISNTHFAPVSIRLRPGHFRHIVPRYPSESGNALPGAQAERRMLEQRFGAKAITPGSKAVKKVLKTPLAHDILHFACHGLADPESILDAHLMMQGKMEGGHYQNDLVGSHWTRQFASLQDDDRCGPLVFLNACQIAREGNQLTGTGGFAQSFLRAGASAFIGSLWSIGDVAAVTFSQTLYEELIDNESNMMDAVIRARQAARNNQEMTWLAYAVYADPYAYIERE